MTLKSDNKATLKQEVDKELGHHTKIKYIVSDVRKDLQKYKLEHTTLSTDVEDIKHIPEVVDSAKSIVNNPDDYELEQKEMNDKKKEILDTIFDTSTVVYDEDEFVDEDDEELTDEELIQALEFGGVDNWEYYDESISNFRDEYDIPEDEALSPEDKLYALQMGGIDNWTYYYDSIENYIKEYKN